MAGTSSSKLRLIKGLIRNSDMRTKGMTLVKNVKRALIKVENKMVSGSIILTKKKSTGKIGHRKRNENNIVGKTKSRCRERRDDVRR